MHARSPVIRVAAALAVSFGAVLALSAQAPRRVTIDDLMGLKTINDVEIAVVSFLVENFRRGSTPLTACRDGAGHI